MLKHYIISLTMRVGHLTRIPPMPLPLNTLKATTGFGVDPAGNDYGGTQLTLEEAIDLAESDVQGIASLVNVLYTEQARAN